MSNEKAAKPLCILHANCQGDELETLLLASAHFCSRYRLERYTNYTRETIPESSLQSCSVFIYQYLGDEWDELATNVLLESIPASALRLRIPNTFFNGYWPLWTRNSPIDFGDSLLDRLIDEGTPKEGILKLYLHKDLNQFVDLKQALEQCILKERQREQGACVSTVDWILERWKISQVFHTVNHPGRELLVHIVQGILRALDCPELDGQDLSGLPEHFPSYSDFDLPIHPQVARFHSLRFVLPGQTYAVFNRRMNFEQYVSRYIDCRLNGYENEFLAYLQLV